MAGARCAFDDDTQNGILRGLYPYDGIRVYIVTVLSDEARCTFTTLIDLFISLLCRRGTLHKNGIETTDAPVPRL